MSFTSVESRTGVRTPDDDGSAAPAWRRAAAWLWRRAAGGGSLAMLDQAIYSAGNFLSAVIIARAGAAPEFGIYFLGMRLIDYLREVENVLIWAPYMFFAPRMSRAEQVLYTGSTLVHQLLMSALGALLLIVAGVVLSGSAQSSELVPAIWPLALVAAMLPWQEYSRRICFANFQIKTVTVLDTLVTLLQLGGLAWLAKTGRLSIGSAYWTIGAVNGLAACCWLIWARRDLALAADRVAADFRRNFAMGKWLLGGNLTQLAGQQVYPWSLGSWHGVAATGSYAAGEGIINFIRVFLMSVQNYLGPRLAHAWARGGMRELRQEVNQVTWRLGAIVGGLCLIVALFGGRLAAMIYGHQYSGLHLMIVLLSANILAQAFTIGHSYAITAIERQDLNVKINLAGLAVTATAGLLAARAWGPLGAGAGLLISTLTCSMLRMAMFTRLAKRKTEGRA
ncbi:MAG TPA: hypothetical protein VJ302_21355 [Blastocatellia bacterium]|nr:hypothetical protein [Blastocatellia bacterium]